MTLKKRLASLLISMWVAAGIASVSALAQEAASNEQQQKERAALEEKALNLLDQVIGEAQSLKLPENRVRIQFTAADLLWERQEARARALFSAAAAGIAEMMQGIDSNDRQYFQLIQVPSQLRQELLTAAARRDAPLAYELLRATRQLAPPQNAPNGPNFRWQDQELNLELNLLAQMAATDPRLALQNAEEMLDKGQFPNSLAKLLAQLQLKDKDAAGKLAEKLLKRLRQDTMLANQEAGSLALNLLRLGPRPAETPSNSPQTNLNNSGQLLNESAFRELMESVIATALNATPRTAAAQQRGPAARLGPGNLRSGQQNVPGGQQSAPSTQDSAQIAQDNARRLLTGLQPLLPYVDKYLPARAPAVRQKLGEVGGRMDPRAAFGDLNNLMRQGSVDELLQAASTAPPGMQGVVYQQAAMKALNEGNTERARQIATEHLDQGQRNQVLQAVERQQAVQAAAAGNIEEAQQQLARLRSDEQRVNWLTQMATAAAQKKNEKLAAQLLEEARNLVSRRAENYQQLEARLRVVRAYAGIDPARGFELLESGIDQLNELLPAAAALSGFEVRIFKDGEFPLQGGSQLSNMITRYGQELTRLARSDFERAQTVADKFQRAEPRIQARLSIVRGVLGGQAQPEADNAIFGRGFGPLNRGDRRP
jgi:hypothetical protein